MLSVLLLNVVMLSVVISKCYKIGLNAGCNYAECRYAKCLDFQILQKLAFMLGVIMLIVVMLRVVVPSTMTLS